MGRYAIAIGIIIFFAPTFLLSNSPSFHYLVLPYSARGEALNFALAASPIADGIPVNPAVEPSNPLYSVLFSYRRHLIDTKQYSLILWKRLGKLGLSVILKDISTSGIEKRDTPTNEPDLIFSSHQVAGGFAISSSFTNFLRVGAGMVVAYEDIDLYHHSAIVFNMGFLAKFDKLCTSLSILNIGGEERTKKEKFTTPTLYNGALYYRIPFYPFKNNLSLSFGISKPNYDKIRYILGFSYDYRFISLVSSYKSYENLGKFSFGASIKKGSFTLDYVVSPYSSSFYWGHHITFKISR